MDHTLEYDSFRIIQFDEYNQLLIEYVIHSRKSYKLRSMKTKLILMQFVSKRVGKHAFIMLSI